MLIKPRYSPRDLLLWTRRETIVFLVYAIIVVALHAVLGLSFLQVPWAPLAVVGTAVAFIVGFQNNAAYGRIWEARKIWGGVVNVSRTFGMQVLDMVEGPKESNSTAQSAGSQHTQLIHRHIAWLSAMRHAMRTPRKWEEFNSQSSNREWSNSICIPERVHSLEEELSSLLTKEEQEQVLARSNKATALLNLQSRHLTQLKDSGQLWDFAYLELQQHLREMFTLQGKSERIKNFPYPRQYATLSFTFVRLFVLLLPFAAVPEFAQVGNSLSGDWPALAPHFVWIAVPFCALISWVFHTMERIGRVGENPFEGTANDVPISTIARGIEIDLRQMLGEAESEIPEPFPARQNVQM